MKKICPYCQEEFETSLKGHTRIPCFELECIERHKQARRKQSKDKQAQYRQKGRIQKENTKSLRLERKRETAKKPWPYYCQTCERLGRKTKLHYPNRFNCPKCQEMYSEHGVIDDPEEVYGGLSY